MVWVTRGITVSARTRLLAVARLRLHCQPCNDLVSFELRYFWAAVACCVSLAWVGHGTESWQAACGHGDCPKGRPTWSEGPRDLTVRIGGVHPNGKPAPFARGADHGAVDMVVGRCGCDRLQNTSIVASWAFGSHLDGVVSSLLLSSLLRRSITEVMWCSSQHSPGAASGGAAKSCAPAQSSYRRVSETWPEPPSRDNPPWHANQFGAFSRVWVVWHVGDPRVAYSGSRC